MSIHHENIPTSHTIDRPNWFVGSVELLLQKSCRKSWDLFHVPIEQYQLKIKSLTKDTPELRPSMKVTSHCQGQKKHFWLWVLHSCLSITHGEEVGLFVLQSLSIDMVAALGEATATPYFINKLRNSMLLNPVGRRILREKPRITSTTLDVEKLWLLPDNTLGHEYVRWLEVEGVSPDTRATVHLLSHIQLTIRSATLMIQNWRT